jgi:hypothetical protein
MRHSPPYLVLAFLLATAGLGYASMRDGDGIAASRATVAASRGDAPLRIRGSVEGLYPGLRAQLRLRIRNRSSRRLTVHSIDVRAGDAGPDCLRQNLLTHKRRLRLPIEPHTRRRARLGIIMAADAGDACQGATFPLEFRARARP